MNRQKKKKLRSRTRTSRPSITSRILDIKPEDLARYARDAEQQALPIIKKIEVSPGAAIGLLAQYTHMLISGKSDVTIEGATKITDSILALWQAGSYHPSEQYPFTLEETLQDFKEGLKVKGDYSKDFQPFTPSHSTPPVGMGQVAGGIAQHPKKTFMANIDHKGWPMCFLGTYRDPNEAQRNLGRVINIQGMERTTLQNIEMSLMKLSSYMLNLFQKEIVSQYNFHSI